MSRGAPRLRLAPGWREVLGACDPNASPSQKLAVLIDAELDVLPLPGAGSTLQRWQALATVAAHDLSLAKLFEGHTDALAILAELNEPDVARRGWRWGVWGAEPPGPKAVVARLPNGRWALRGTKFWCSGAADVTHGLLTAWSADGRGPQLVKIEMNQAAVSIEAGRWQAVGMAGSQSVDVAFDGAVCEPVGVSGQYLARAGFWHGGAGVAACWYGGAVGVARALHRSLAAQTDAARGPFRAAALGKIDTTLRQCGALLREAAALIDAHPQSDAMDLALRVRLAADDAARSVLDESGRALGAAAYCLDPHFAQAAADLPVFIRQCHGERDFAALGQWLANGDGDAQGWAL